LAATESSTSKEDVEEKNDSEEEPLAINKICRWNPSTSKNFYPRPSPPDLQYEERGSFTSASFDGNSIHT